ncbi:alpha/beta hydrolase fold domain-containing protein [Nocardia sp. alder85J]|uniref:alpha/beta hydrolase fold domain-containing protein n=1 Tax=Nocardia sp. alder85J TaxID=2862949 RepID=UPI001CD505DD|nr:alpha/beta hydrolase fold domain-containing protein [Nocardia sp. alder85J]MCX4095996.1 alpha/beta hydrolase fold domain-containing protein [Nocardia sp. alder85J]
MPKLPDISLPLPVARAVLHPIFRYTMHARVPWRIQRALLDAASVLQQSPPGTRVQRLRLGGRPAEQVAGDRPAVDAGAVLYLHGGGYTVGSPVTHRSLAAHLARELRRPVYLPDYRLAPEHPYPAALDDAEAAFLDLLATGRKPENLVVAGDSAGGGLALALAQRLRDAHGIVPAALGLIAPWADPNEKPGRARDLVINERWSRAAAAAYLGEGSGLDVGYAPLLGRLAGLPPVYVQVDTDELLHGQCVRLVAGLEAAGVPARFSVTHGLWHVAQLQAALVAPAAAELRDMAEFLGRALEPVAAESLG